MQVGVLDNVNTIGIQKGNHQISEEGDSFSTILSEFIGPTNSTKTETEKIVVVDDALFTKEEIMEILQLLQSGEQLSAEGNSASDWMNENEPINKELVSTIISIFDDVDWNEIDGPDSLQLMDDFSHFKEQLMYMDLDEALKNVAHFIPLIDVNKMTFMKKDGYVELALCLKDYEMANGNNSIEEAEHPQLKEFIKNVIDKLESQLKQNVLDSRTAYLFNRFTSVVKEINGMKTIIPIQKVAPEPIDLNRETTETKTSHSNPNFNTTNLSSTLMKQDQLILLQNNVSKTASTAQLIQQFESILSKGQYHKIGGNQKLFIKLYPEHLGALRIELQQNEAGMIAKMFTSTAAAKDILESQIQSLKQAFLTQNIQVDKIEISNQVNYQERFIQKDPQQQEEHSQKQEKEEEKRQEQDQIKNISFEEALLNLEV